MDIRISQYILESGICLLVFYGIYYFWLKKETFFQLNRGYLLATAVLSVLIPLTHWSLPAPELDPTVQEQVLTPTETQISTDMPGLVRQWHETQPVIWAPIEQARPASILTVGQLLWLIYAIGIAIMAFRFLQKFSFLHRLIRQSKKQNENGYTLVKTKSLEASSFLGYVFWHEDRKDNPMILEHELVHIRQRHSLDILLMEMLVIFLWFNPIIYWFRNSLKEVHEFIADQVVTQKHSAYDYACLLVQSHQQHVQPQLFNTFNSFIKNRLLMLHNQPSSNWRLMKYLISMPILAALIILFALDFSKKLPEEVTQPFEAAGEMIEEAEKVQVIVNNQEFLKESRTAADGTTYQIRWDDKLCNCYPESGQTPNYFECEGFSIAKSTLTSARPFQLLKNGSPVTVDNLWVRSNVSVQMGNEETQMVDAGNFAAARPFIQALDKGEVIRFNFESGKEAGFYFHVLINDENNSIRYMHEIEIGNELISIDPMNMQGRKKIGFATYQKIMDEPIQLRMSDGRLQAATKMEVRVNYQLSGELTGKKSYRLSDFPATRWMVEPRNFVYINYYMDEELVSEASITLEIENDENHKRGPVPFAMMWNNYVVMDPFVFFDDEDLKEFFNEKPYFFLNNKKLKVKSVDHVVPDLINGPKENVRTRFSNLPGSEFNETLKKGLAYLKNGGNSFYMEGIELENGLKLNRLHVHHYHNFDPAEVYQKGMADFVLPKGRDKNIELKSPQHIDLDKLENLVLFGEDKLYVRINKTICNSEEARKEAFDHLKLSADDKVTLYLPGSKIPLDNSSIVSGGAMLVRSGYIDITDKDFDADIVKTKLIKSR